MVELWLETYTHSEFASDSSMNTLVGHQAFLVSEMEESAMGYSGLIRDLTGITSPRILKLFQ